MKTSIVNLNPSVASHTIWNRMRQSYCTVLILLSLLGVPPHLAAQEFLPAPINIQLVDNVLSWDASPSATGYNIYLGELPNANKSNCFPVQYLTTVRATTSFKVDQTGWYSVIAFDESGSETIFSKQVYSCDDVAIFDPSDTQDLSDLVIRDSWMFTLVIKTCRNVGPGESCVAACPETPYGAHVTGGACTTSDIVEADSFMGPGTYKCTVPTFSGEVITQASCLNLHDMSDWIYSLTRD